MGMVSATQLSSKLIERFRPRVIVMPGICAGISGKTDFGDVILAEMTWDYQSGKHVSASDSLAAFHIDPHFIQVDPTLKAKWEVLASDDGLRFAVWKGWPKMAKAPPRLLCGPMASGSAVLASSAVTDSIVKQQRKTLAVEMESYGVYFAAEMAVGPRPLVCCMKAVCDFADVRKDDSQQEYAAFTSAMFVRRFFERYMSDFSDQHRGV